MRGPISTDVSNLFLLSRHIVWTRRMGPRLRVRSRGIVECLARCQVAEAFEAGEIVVVDEAMEEGIAIGMRGKAAMGDATFRLPADGFGDAPVEAFGETIGLGPVRSGEAVVDLALGAETIEGMSAGRSVVPLVLHVDSEAIGELTAIVGEDRMNAMWKVGEEAFEEAGGSVGIAPGMDLQINVAGRPIDGHKGIAFASFQGRQMLEIDMNEADGRLFEDTDRRLAGHGPFTQPMPLETAVGGAAGDLGIDTAPHHLGDVVERQLQSRSQLADQRFFQRRELGRQPLRRVRSVGHRRSTAPPIDRRLAHSQFVGKLRDRLLAALDIGANFWGCRGISVQTQLHDARRSLRYEMPRSTPIPSNQSPGTEHAGGDPYAAARRCGRDNDSRDLGGYGSPPARGRQRLGSCQGRLSTQVPARAPELRDHSDSARADLSLPLT